MGFLSKYWWIGDFELLDHSSVRTSNDPWIVQNTDPGDPLPDSVLIGQRVWPRQPAFQSHQFPSLSRRLRMQSCLQSVDGAGALQGWYPVTSRHCHLARSGVQTKMLHPAETGTVRGPWGWTMGVMLDAGP